MLQARRGDDSNQEKERRSGLGKTVLFTGRPGGSDEKSVWTHFTVYTMEEDFHFRKDLL